MGKTLKKMVNKVAKSTKASAKSKKVSGKGKKSVKSSTKKSGKKKNTKVLAKKKKVVSKKSSVKKSASKKSSSVKKGGKQGVVAAKKNGKAVAANKVKKGLAAASKLKKGLSADKKIKSRHVTVYEVEPNSNVLQTDVDNDDDMLNQLIHPVKSDVFFEKHWGPKQAAAFLGGGATRSLPFKKMMDGLDLKSLLERSPSDGIMCWMKPQDKHKTPGREHCVPLESITTDEASALKLHECFGAALYFRAPEEVSEAVLQPLCGALGMNFTSYFSDGAPRSETETFVAKKGHLTGWHTDFQNNFTIQLKGRRRWRLRHEYAAETVPGTKVKQLEKDPNQTKHAENNVRGRAPHYATMETYETQMKAVTGCRDGEMKQFLPPKEFFDDAQEVILEPGDVLFHPAGVWHQVEALDDCVAINFSLLNQSYADIIGASCVHALTAAGGVLTERVSFPPHEFQSFEEVCADVQKLRADNGLEPEQDEHTLRIIYERRILKKMQSKFDKKIEEAQRILEDALDSLTVLPPCMVTPRKTFIRVSDTMPPLMLSLPDDLWRNSLATIVHLTDDETREEDSADEDAEEEYSQIAVHVNFFGQERLESLCRTVISFPTRLKPLVDMAITHKRDTKLNPDPVVGTGPNADLKEKLFGALVYAGYFTAADRGETDDAEHYCDQIKNPDL